MSDLEVKVTDIDIEKIMFKFLVKVFRGYRKKLCSSFELKFSEDIENNYVQVFS